MGVTPKPAQLVLSHFPYPFPFRCGREQVFAAAHMEPKERGRGWAFNFIFLLVWVFGYPPGSPMFPEEGRTDGQTDFRTE